MTPVDGAVLLGVFVIAGMFAAYEMEGLQRAGIWHTISYYAQHNRWLGRGIALLGLVGFAVFELWWRHHLGTQIPR